MSDPIKSFWSHYAVRCVKRRRRRAALPMRSLPASADDVGAGGTRKALYGTSPSGILIFMPDRTYALQIHASGVPKFASGDRLKATPEEYKAVVLANNPHWGKYTLNDADKTLGSRFPQELWATGHMSLRVFPRIHSKPRPPLA